MSSKGHEMRSSLLIDLFTGYWGYGWFHSFIISCQRPDVVNCAPLPPMIG
ncbi:uncharacterized protein MYCFIDRAFT_177959 [Pseudocercospora fijiensis CIRAD86]|uniref:Uncharacterized protein n=1 Tax=Pseudocercospora fijiensis (strain CIRAD86) TaxID=383855 RepID=M2ZJS5_PSEFD|nr:uncharacterized protein MYCFIDRAFT_177959 [Pseudocercospora fijiensis CIRAD86]EME79354.1 hypothetical protein MYCFIDRAFT_177959 [Pseudocercospora fijiensis CIRAD86]